MERKTRLRRILRRKRVKRAIKAYGNYIAAGVLVFVVCVAVVGAAVKPTASTLPKNTPEPVQTTQPTGNKVYGWEITAVKEYPRTVTLEELGMKRAPQSWQYMR